MSALDRRWVRWLVRLAALVASVPAAVLLTFGLVALVPSDWQWALAHSGMPLLMIPVLAIAFYLVAHLATSRWPWP